MLVLKCRPGTAVRVGEEIVLRVDLVVGPHACVSVECPPTMTVMNAAEASMLSEIRSRGISPDLSRARVLSSEATAELIVGGDVRVTVLSVHRNGVRIGVEAPQHLAVRRDDGPGAQPAAAGATAG